jgi:heme exporter protein C
MSASSGTQPAPAAPLFSPALSERASKVLPLLAGATALMLVGSLYLVFAVAPQEAQMGIVQKVFYFHVPSAYAMYVGWFVCAVSSGVWLWKRSDAWDAWAVAGAEVGLVFCAIVLVTGPLWARKAWGVYWTWDPRLTSTLLGGLMFFAYLTLRNLGGGGLAEKRFASALALLGIPNAALIHFSVRRWRGQHPQVISGRGGGLSADMKPAFFFALATFTALVVLLLWARARAERTRQAVLRLELDAAERGLLEDA